MIKMLTLLKEIENATKLNGRKELNKEKRKKYAVKTCSSLCGENLGEEIHAQTMMVLLGGGRVVWMGQEVAVFCFHTNSLRHGRQAK